MNKVTLKLKAIFSTILLFAMLVSSMSIYAASTKTLKASKETITRGAAAQVSVKIELSDVIEVANIGFTLKYDKDVFEVSNDDVELDDWLKNKLSLDFRVHQNKGEVVVQGGNSDNIDEMEAVENVPIGETATIATIKFRPNSNASAGTYPLTFNKVAVVKVENGKGVTQDIDIEPGSITIRTGGSRPGQSSDPSKYTGGGDQKPDDQKPDDEKPDDEKPDDEKPDDEKPSDGPTSVDSFEDISESLEWSKPAIDYLVKRGIISGTSENSFEPERSITRAEFTKIIVAAFGFEDTEGDVSFTDVNDDDWYSEFVKIAVKNGLVQGYPEGDFRPNATITREEMATILVRAFKALGIDIETGDVDFADSEEIGDWAAEYVAALANLGIVQGRGDNMFVPKDNLTRAEAAVVIYKSIMQLFENQ